MMRINLLQAIIVMLFVSVAFCNSLKKLRDVKTENVDKWTFCANVGNVCRTKGIKLVRINLNNKYLYKWSQGSITCNNKTFGVSKSTKLDGSKCEFNDIDLVWTLCAEENSKCKFDGKNIVRFGANGKFRYIMAKSSLKCSQKKFKGDPAIKKQKFCWYATNINSSKKSWKKCANDKEKCKFSGSKIVRYGLNGNYFYIRADNSVDCSKNIFGNPYINKKKICEVEYTNENSEDKKPVPPTENSEDKKPVPPTENSEDKKPVPPGDISISVDVISFNDDNYETDSNQHNNNPAVPNSQENTSAGSGSQPGSDTNGNNVSIDSNTDTEDQDNNDETPFSFDTDVTVDEL